MGLNSESNNSSMVHEEKKKGVSLEDEKNHTSFYQTINDFYEWLCCWIMTLSSICSFMLFFYMCFKPSLWILLALYLLWMYVDRKTPHRGGRRLKWIRKLKLWRCRRDYFPIKLVKTAELPPNATYLFACFPHGVNTFGASTNFIFDVNQFDELFPGLVRYFIIADFIFNIPIGRDVALFYGNCSCSPESISHILNGSPGNVCILQVGGFHEMLKSSPGTNRLFLKNRKGFVRMALKSGSSLVPVFSFGETDVYDQPTGDWYKWLVKFFLSMPVRWVGGLVLCLCPTGPRTAAYLYGLLPHKRPITTVVGRSIKLPKVENPSDELVDKFHKIFTQELISLYEKNKVKYDSQGEKGSLVIE